MTSEEGSPPPNEEGDVSFDWTEYLDRTRAKKAPRSAFFQPLVLPENRFKVGQLVLAKDPHAHLMVLAKIRDIHKCWLYIHIEGLDESQCRWIICDDRDLAPVGPKNEELKADNRDAYPPTGMKTIFKKWIVQQFEGQEENIADVSLFQTISPKHQPKGLLFEVGMKLAAYDEKSFEGKLSPATVIDVNYDRATIKLNFDGWSSSFDITIPYNSRCIFPIDFVESAGLEVNPPPLPSPDDSPEVEDDEAQWDDAGNGHYFDENEEENDGLAPKRRRMGFFDPSERPMRPGQRAAAMKEQMTGVKAKVIDILRGATQEQERMENSDPRRYSPKYTSILPKVVRIEGGQMTPVHPVSDGRHRPIAPKPTVVYQNSNSGIIFVPRQGQPSRPSPVQNDPRIVTRTGARTVTPSHGLLSMTGPAKSVTTPSGDFILAAPNIKSALRQTLEDSPPNNDRPLFGELAGLREEKEDPDSGPKRPEPTVVRIPRMGSPTPVQATIRRPAGAAAHQRLLTDEERAKMGWPAGARTGFPASNMRTVSVRPTHTPSPHGFKRVNYVSKPYSPAVTVATARSPAPQGTVVHMKRPLQITRPRISISSLAAMAAKDMAHRPLLPPSSTTPLLLGNAANRPLNYTPRHVAGLPPRSEIVEAPPLLEAKIDEYKRETKTVQKNVEDAIVKMYVNKGCHSGPMLDSEKIGKLHDYLLPLPYHAQVARVVQDLLYCAWEPKDAFDLIKNLGPQAPGMKITIIHEQEILTKTIPIHLSSASAFMWVRDFLTTLNCCPNLVSASEFSCEGCNTAEKEDHGAGSPPERVPKYKREYDVLKKLGAHLGDCAEVAEEFRKRLGDDVAQMILDNQIDASVLPFCQEDLLREQMKLPYNTALKMAAVACELRAAAFESVPGVDRMDLDIK